MKKFTEREMLDLLHKRHQKIPRGFPPRYILAEHVRDDANSAKRIADFMVQDTWRGGDAPYGMPHRQYPIHGFEVKISRKDWLTELRQPDKALAFIPYVHYWWLVIADQSMVVLDELPAGWGLLVPRGRGLGAVVPAIRNENTLPMPPGMRVGLARSITKTKQPNDGRKRDAEVA